MVSVRSSLLYLKVAQTPLALKVALALLRSVVAETLRGCYHAGFHIQRNMVVWWDQELLALIRQLVRAMQINLRPSTVL